MKLFKFMKNLRKDTDGATMIEYAILASLISVVAIVAITGVGTKVKSTFEGVETAMPAAR